MINLRPARERGHADHGWLDSWHTFSFADYHDPDHMGYRTLRVINDDRVAPGMGFGRHPHRDMEIITCVLDGALRHDDSLGNGSAIRPGEVQRMTAGTGVTHSEKNASAVEPVHFLQIWILPERRGLTPGYEQKMFADPEKRNRLALIASPDGRDGSLTVHQDVNLLATCLDPGAAVRHDIGDGRHLWVQVAAGAVTLNGRGLVAGDGAAVEEEASIEIVGSEESEVLLFDLN